MIAKVLSMKMHKITNGKITLQETAGLRQVYLQSSVADDFDAYALELLRGHYEQK